MRRAAAVFLCFATCLALAPSAEAALRFKRCGPYGFTCARLSVPLDRSGAVPGRVSLLVKRVRARRRGGATRPPLFVLAGGPGQSATDAFGPDSLGVLFPAYRNRDLVIFDQRGSGGSGLLRCRRLERANLLRAGAAAGACARQLGARRAFYTSRDSADDIDAIREQLGAEQVALYGTSYGTKLALGYALRYPARVERLVLDSTVEADGPDPFYLDTFDAVPRALRIALPQALPLDGRPGRRPRGAGRAPGARLAARARGGPARAHAGTAPHARGRVLDPPCGRLRPDAARRLPRRRARRAVRRRDAAAASSQARVRGGRGAAAAPAAQLGPLRRDHVRGDPASMGAHDPAGPGRAAAARPPPRPRRSRTPSSSPSTGPPRSRATRSTSVSAGRRRPWRRSSDPARCPDVPVLLLEGEDDLRTPVENARRVAELFPRSSLVVAPATGHSALGSDFSGCTDRAFARFFQERSVPVRCPRARRFFLPSPPPPRRLRSVPPLAGTSGLRGRTLAAVRLTLRDVAEDSITELIFDLDDPDLARGGGLRAGHYRIDAREHARARRRRVRAGRHAQRAPGALRRAPPARPAPGERPRRTPTGCSASSASPCADGSAAAGCART